MQLEELVGLVGDLEVRFEAAEALLLGGHGVAPGSEKVPSTEPEMKQCAPNLDLIGLRIDAELDGAGREGEPGGEGEHSKADPGEDQGGPSGTPALLRVGERLGGEVDRLDENALGGAIVSRAWRWSEPGSLQCLLEPLLDLQSDGLPFEPHIDSNVIAGENVAVA